MSDRRSSEKARFIQLLGPQQGPLERFCRRALSQPDETEDVLQTVVTLAFRDFSRFADGTSFRAWIFQYTTFEVFNRNRAAARRRTVVPLCDETEQGQETPNLLEFTPLQEPDAIIDRLADDFDQAVLTALSELPEKQRSILLLRSIGEFGYQDIAEMLDIPVGTVMGLLSRARAILRVRLHAYAKEYGLIDRGNSA